MNYDISFLINTSINVNNDAHVWCNRGTNDFNCNCNKYYALQKHTEPFEHLDLSCLKGGEAFSESCWVVSKLDIYSFFVIVVYFSLDLTLCSVYNTKCAFDTVHPVRTSGSKKFL